MGYGEKLKDPRWQKRRLEIMERDGWICAKCGDATKPLNVHHLSYSGEPWEAPDDQLVTLCEDCHRQAHDPSVQKHDPSAYDKVVRVYAAGKVSKGDWRSKIAGIVPQNDEGDLEPQHREKLISVVDRVAYVYVGPWFIRCDHGCYHGDRQHGVGAWSGGCLGDDPGFDHCFGERRESVVRVSFEGIAAADVVYALLDHPDQFGTLVEVGYAAGIGKPIVMDCVTDDRMWNDLWFARYTAMIDPGHEYQDVIRQVLGVGPVLDDARYRALAKAMEDGQAPEEVMDAGKDPTP